MTNSKPSSIMNPICRGIVGYVSYLATCNASTVYSEYLLYEPVMRIAQSKGFYVTCEYPLKSEMKRRGDHKRIDFKLVRNDYVIGLEVKWIKNKHTNIVNDIDKLNTFVNSNSDKNPVGYLLVFGKGNAIKEFSKINKFVAKSKIVEWISGKTHYAASWVEIKK